MKARSVLSANIIGVLVGLYTVLVALATFSSDDIHKGDHNALRAVPLLFPGK